MGKNYYRLLLWVFSLAAIICTSARILLVLRFTDHSTGFYSQASGIAVVYNIAFWAAVLLLFAATQLRKPANDYPVYRQNRSLGALGFLVAASIVLFVLLDEPYPVMEQGYNAMLLQARDVASIALGLIAALSFLLFGIGSLTDRTLGAATVPALFASVWQVFMLVTRFNSYTTLTTIQDNLLAVLFMIFATLFLLGHARTVFGFSRKDGRNYVISAGLCTALSGFALVIPNYAYAAINQTGIPASMLGLWESAYVLLLSLYALIFVVSTIRSIKLV